MSLARRLIEQLGFADPDPKRVPWVVCRDCGLAWPRKDCIEELGEDGRVVGWLCPEDQ